MITQREISRYAFRQGKQDRAIEQDYVITWILLGIADSSLKSCLAFKGGTALKKMYFRDFRYSEDLDFTLTEDLGDADLLNQLRVAFAVLEKKIALVLRIDDDRVEHRRDSITLYIDYIGPLQATLGSRDIKVDFTRREKLINPLEVRQVIAPYSDCENVTRTLRVYPLEEILIEKLCALIGRTEPRDLYDAHYLLDLGHLDYQSIAEDFVVKAVSKNIDPSRLRGVLEKRVPTIERLWKTRLALQVDSLPHLEAVVHETRRYLRKYGVI